MREQAESSARYLSFVTVLTLLGACSGQVATKSSMPGSTTTTRQAVDDPADPCPDDPAWEPIREQSLEDASAAWDEVERLKALASGGENVQGGQSCAVHCNAAATVCETRYAECDYLSPLRCQEAIGACSAAIACYVSLPRPALPRRAVDDLADPCPDDPAWQPIRKQALEDASAAWDEAERLKTLANGGEHVEGGLSCNAQCSAATRACETLMQGCGFFSPFGCRRVRGACNAANACWRSLFQ
jgi:hypothetical protein